MRVLIMGAGAVGGYCGAVLVQHGHDVCFVARGTHLAALQQRGLELRSGGKTSLLQPVQAVANAADAGQHIDLVLFTVKCYDTNAAAESLRTVVGPDCAVLTLQNGIDSVDRLSAVLGAECVLPGTIMIWSVVAAPGVIKETGPFCRMTFGEQSGAVTPRVERIAAAFREAGLEATVSTDARLAIWRKFIGLAPHATITSACDAPVGPIRETEEGLALYRTLISEAVAVGRAAGVALPDDTLESTFAIVNSMPAASKSSMQFDYERRHRVELDSLTGAVVRRGRQLNVPTPGFDTLYAVLKVRALSFNGLA